MTTDKQERNVVLYYLNNIVRKGLSQKREAGFLRWFEEYSNELLGFALDLDEEDVYGRRRRFNTYIDEEGNAREYDIKAVRDLLAKVEITPINVKGYDEKIDFIFDAFGIKADCPFGPEADSREFLRYMIYVETIPMLCELNDELLSGSYHCGNMGGIECYATIIGISRPSAKECIAPDSPLLLKGILAEYDPDHNSKIEFSYPFQKLLRSEFSSIADVKRIILGPTAKAELKPEHFNYLADDFDFIKTALRTSIRKRMSGINVLLYGKPGTGKTEMCKSLAAEIGADLYMISENSDGDKSERASELALAQTVLRDDKNAVILMDEAEDVFYQNPWRGRSYSKLYFNRMLEKNVTPVIWVSNHINAIDRAHIRRFTYALEMPEPDLEATQGIWRNVLAKHKVKLPPEKITEYAKRYEVAPSFIDTAVKSVKLVKDPAAIERTIDSLHKASQGMVPMRKPVETIAFEPSLLNTDMNLEELADKIVSKGVLKISLCLFGVPGTGKSAYARHLAEKMKLKVVQKRASDLQSKWVGETEQNIARTFNEAFQKKSLLIFDEADSFLGSREKAMHSWEISQVNEMLTWMENHPYPVVFTTNLMDTLDEASLRRFKFKVKYDFLTPLQVNLAFKYFFGFEPDASTAHSTTHLTALTPGDFVVVKDKMELMDVADHIEIVKMLETEQAVKKCKPQSRIGF